MKPRIILLCLGLLLTARAAQAQWVVTDPTNLAQGIINSTKQIVEAARNGSTLLQSFQETVKIYEQGKRYYDALKAVNNLVRSARKVQQCMLLVGEISDIYVNSYQRMVVDDNFSAAELAAIATGYARIIEESAGELKELQDIVNPTDMSLTRTASTWWNGSMACCATIGIWPATTRARTSPSRCCAGPGATTSTV